MHNSFEQLMVALILILLLVCGLTGYFLFTIMKRFNRYQSTQDGYSKAKMEAIEKERQLVANDLHDDMGPILSGSLHMLSCINPVTEREQEMLRKVSNHMNELYQRIRTISTAMSPQAISRKGPFYALEEYADICLDGSSLQLYMMEMPRPMMDENRSLHLFRILQEILCNTLKHANATRLTVDAWVENNMLNIETSDDGIGFEPAKAQGTTGIGLQSIALRASILNARLSSQSWPGKGTKYQLQVPLMENKK